jgi:hypothetical protein
MQESNCVFSKDMLSIQILKIFSTIIHQKMKSTMGNHVTFIGKVMIENNKQTNKKTDNYKKW